MQCEWKGWQLEVEESFSGVRSAGTLQEKFSLFVSLALPHTAFLALLGAPGQRRAPWETQVIGAGRWVSSTAVQEGRESLTFQRHLSHRSLSSEPNCWNSDARKPFLPFCTQTKFNSEAQVSSVLLKIFFSNSSDYALVLPERRCGRLEEKSALNCWQINDEVLLTKAC